MIIFACYASTHPHPSSFFKLFDFLYLFFYVQHCYHGVFVSVLPSVCLPACLFPLSNRSKSNLFPLTRPRSYHPKILPPCLVTSTTNFIPQYSQVRFMFSPSYFLHIKSSLFECLPANMHDVPGACVHVFQLFSL